MDENFFLPLRTRRRSLSSLASFSSTSAMEPHHPSTPTRSSSRPMNDHDGCPPPPPSIYSSYSPTRRVPPFTVPRSTYSSSHSHDTHGTKNLVHHHHSPKLKNLIPYSPSRGRGRPSCRMDRRPDDSRSESDDSGAEEEFLADLIADHAEIQQLSKQANALLDILREETYKDDYKNFLYNYQYYLDQYYRQNPHQYHLNSNVSPQDLALYFRQQQQQHRQPCPSSSGVPSSPSTPLVKKQHSHDEDPEGLNKTVYYSPGGGGDASDAITTTSTLTSPSWTTATSSASRLLEQPAAQPQQLYVPMPEGDAYYCYYPHTMDTGYDDDDMSSLKTNDHHSLASLSWRSHPNLVPPPSSSPSRQSPSSSPRRRPGQAAPLGSPFRSAAAVPPAATMPLLSPSAVTPPLRRNRFTNATTTTGVTQPVTLLSQHSSSSFVSPTKKKSRNTMILSTTDQTLLLSLMLVWSCAVSVLWCSSSRGNTQNFQNHDDELQGHSSSSDRHGRQSHLFLLRNDGKFHSWWWTHNEEEEHEESFRLRRHHLPGSLFVTPWPAFDHPFWMFHAFHHNDGDDTSDDISLEESCGDDHAKTLNFTQRLLSPMLQDNLPSQWPMTTRTTTTTLVRDWN